MTIVFINPGHDLDLDPGAVNKELGLRESEIVHDVGELVDEYLTKVGYKIYTYQDDDLDEVCSFSNVCGAQVFVSIHCNAGSPQATGTEVIYNKGSKKGIKLANCIQKQLVSSLGTIDRGIKDRIYIGNKVIDHFQVLTDTTAPAVIVEMGFITNNEEANMLINKQDELARAIARGITDYFAGVV